MSASTRLPRVEFALIPRDAGRRRRETSRVRMRGRADRTVVAILTIVACGLLVWLGILLPGTVPDRLVVIVPLVAILLLAAWAVRAVRPVPPRRWRRRPPPEDACEVRESGLQVVSKEDEITYDWSVVPSPVREANWIVLDLPMGEVTIPRQAFVADGEEAFIRAVEERRGRISSPSVIPGSAARFEIDEEVLAAAGVPSASRVATTALLGVALASALLVGITRVVTPMPTIGEVGIAACCLLLGGEQVREQMRARRKMFSAFVGPRAVWVDGASLVQRGEGWEHRLDHGQITSVQRAGPLVHILAGGAGISVAAAALSDAPDLAALVAPHLTM